MSSKETFMKWVAHELGVDEAQLHHIHLDAAFELLVSRFELARRRGAKDPLTTGATSRAGGNSRVCTKRMLDHLAYRAPERRAVQRLLVGTTSGWPGLLRLYAADRHLTVSDRQYARRQLAVFTRRSPRTEG